MLPFAPVTLALDILLTIESAIEQLALKHRFCLIDYHLRFRKQVPQVRPLDHDRVPRAIPAPTVASASVNTNTGSVQ